jgi:hypothetical protein
LQREKPFVPCGSNHRLGEASRVYPQKTETADELKAELKKRINQRWGESYHGGRGGFEKILATLYETAENVPPQYLKFLKTGQETSE